jgi:hypothetical protein
MPKKKIPLSMFVVGGRALIHDQIMRVCFLRGHRPWSCVVTRLCFTHAFAYTEGGKEDVNRVKEQGHSRNYFAGTQNTTSPAAYAYVSHLTKIFSKKNHVFNPDPVALLARPDDQTTGQHTRGSRTEWGPGGWGEVGGVWATLRSRAVPSPPRQ